MTGSLRKYNGTVSFHALLTSTAEHVLCWSPGRRVAQEARKFVTDLLQEERVGVVVRALQDGDDALVLAGVQAAGDVRPELVPGTRRRQRDLATSPLSPVH